jgi:Putative adhesin
MTRRSLIAAAIALSATMATSAYAADVDATFDKSLSVSGAPILSVSTGSGYVHVTTGSDNQVHVIGHVHSQSGWLFSSASADAAKQIAANPPITQSGNTITIATPHNDDGLFRNISIDYDITTPRSTNLTAHSGSGGIQITGIQAPVTAGSGSGSLHLLLAGSNQVKASTGSGTIHIEGVTGGLNASTGSGSIEVTGNLTTDWRLSTGSGSIRLKLADNARFNLDASTGSGSVHVDQPITMQGSLNHHHVSGTVNGGGPLLHATTGSGSITINGNATSAQLGDSNSLHVPGATDCVDNPSQPSCRKN